MQRAHAVIAVLIGVGIMATSAWAAETGQDALFNKLDLNKDGVISREEFTSCPLVRTRDGHIQHRDLCASPGVALSIAEKKRLFERIEGHNDHAITRNRLNRFATPDGFAPIRF